VFGTGWSGKSGVRVTALSVAIAGVMATAGTYALAHTTSASQRAAAQRAARQSATQQEDGEGAAAGSPAAGSAAPLQVVAVSPATGSRHANGSQVTVTFSAPLAAGSPMPSLTPAVRGRWHAVGAVAIFTPRALFDPARRVTLRVPAGTGGVRSAHGGLLAQPVVTRFTARAPSDLRLGQLLAQLGYLPLSWSPVAAALGRPEAGPGAAAPAPVPGSLAARSTAAQIADAYSPPPGTFRWHHGYPASLHADWRPGHPGLILSGALMAFQSQHGLTMDGTASPAVWDAVIKAARAGHANPDGYTYALASKVLPETLTIWHDGRVVMRTAANTGIPVAPTSDGTFPVYLRYRFQIMRGLNPDGSAYADPVSYVAYFHGGQAVHYFPRGSYGFEQSLGCVELPLTAAAQAWPYLTYGSLVTVSG
jgi:peptidoglycan hydrolase-like protein with peptidoglycan-binding domain